MNDRSRVRAPNPARPSEDYVRFIPLGGLDEVGMNCAIIECNGSMLLVDCGLTFPETDSFGIDQILPDWSYVLDHLDHLDGVLITHGHEDHIGGLPFFLEEVDVPVYASPLAIGMLKRKLAGSEIENQVDFVAVSAGDRLAIGPFRIEFVHMNHSIPQAMGIALETPLGRVFFTGDWKLDQTAPFEPVADLQRLAEFGREGLLALFGDSTNAEVPGFSRSEREVQRGIAEVIDNAEGRVIVAQFSSNLHRVMGTIEMAARHGRRVVLQGGSLLRNFGIARELGIIKLPDNDVVIDVQEMDRYPDNELVIITTGSQAEPRSSLTRMAYGDHHHIDIGPTDTVILSARQIPGNEYGINFMINNLTKRGATVLTADEGDVHGSGHASAEEIKLMLNLTRPRFLVPVHGEFRMRQRHARLGREVGVPNQMLIENGDVLQFTAAGAEVVGQVHNGRVLVDGKNVGDKEDLQLRDRRQMASAGLIIAVAIIDRASGDMLQAPDLLQRGVVGPSDSDEMLAEAAHRAWDAVQKLPTDARRDITEVKEALRIHIRRYFRRQLDKKPVVVPIVHEL